MFDYVSQGLTAEQAERAEATAREHADDTLIDALARGSNTTGKQLALFWLLDFVLTGGWSDETVYATKFGVALVGGMWCVLGYIIGLGQGRRSK